MEVGLEVSSWACTVSTDTTAVITITQNRGKNRCMFVCSSQSENFLALRNAFRAFTLLLAADKVIKGPKLVFGRQINSKNRKCLLKEGSKTGCKSHIAVINTGSLTNLTDVTYLTY